MTGAGPASPTGVRKFSLTPSETLEIATAHDGQTRTAVADGMRIIWDIPIRMDDGAVLRADLYLPIAPGAYPVVLSHGCYGKGLLMQVGFPTAWELMIKNFPEVAEGTTSKYTSWEVVDPEKWVPDGYACLRIDSRGSGRSPGVFDPMSPRELKDLYDCIEWAGTQPWSNGKVGMAGISYYGQNQWYVAKHKPPHLAAICVWEGCADMYREAMYHGGIMCDMVPNAQDMQMSPFQHGRGERGPRNPVTGDLVCGPETLSDEELADNRIRILETIRSRKLHDEWYAERSADWSKTETPLLSCANWGGQPLHPRGNFDGFVHAASSQKWLEVHGFEHWTLFYTDYGVALQKRFFDHFLKGEDNGWDNEARVQLNVRHPGDVFVPRQENEWPLARTAWSKFYLDPLTMTLGREIPSAAEPLTYEALGKGLTFLSQPLVEPLELTGPAAARLFISSATTDADIFLVLRVLDPAGDDVLFRGALDPQAPVAQGWLRASHRKLDAARSQPWQPFHPHDELWPLTPGEAVQADVEIHPTSIVIPTGYRLGLTVLGRDFEHDRTSATLSNIKFPMRGCGPFLHTDPTDRPPEVFGQSYSLHFDEGRMPYVLLPVIPQ